MTSEHSMVEKVRYYSSVTSLYILTLLFAWFVVHKPSYNNHSVILARALQTPAPAISRDSTTISGTPTRIVLPDSGVDLPIDPGYYDKNLGGWTLSGYHAQYAMITQLANNATGDTFIYGHNNNYVFGALRHHTPTPGAQALVYTDNGHIFAYSFTRSYSISPEDISIFSYQGAPILTVQTCTGSLNEWRTMYQFNFLKVMQ